MKLDTTPQVPAGLAETAPAGTEATPPRVEQALQVELAPATDAQPKWPGDPYAGKCVYWLVGETAARECGR